MKTEAEKNAQECHDLANQFRSAEPDSWERHLRSQQLLRKKSFMLLDALQHAGVEEAGTLSTLLSTYNPDEQLLPASIDNVAIELAQQYEANPTSEIKQLASLAHAANFVVGAEAVREIAPEDPNLAFLKNAARNQINGASITDAAKLMLHRLNQGGV